MNFSGFFAGVAFATFFFAGVFFFKFWRASRDRFFLLFCLSFWLMAAERLALQIASNGCGLSSIPGGINESNSYIYMFRVVAFAFILAAIISKNRAAKNN